MRRVHEGTSRGLAWLASQQRTDGSFPSDEIGQPAVISLAAPSGHILENMTATNVD
jgi:hypothetical protein